MMTMRKVAPLSLLLLAGCASGPRPYDGVLGYRAQPTPTGYAVSYVDEAGTGADKRQRHLRSACAHKLGVAPEQVLLQVTGESRFQQDVDMSVVVPVGMQGIGGNVNRPGGSPGVGGPALQGTVVQHQGVVRTLDLVRTEADCRKAP